MQSSRNKITSSFLWRFLERSGAQSVSFIVSIVLARILAPEVYGTVALVTVFITILQVFVDSGLGNALIQKKDADDLDFSTVFYFNLAACLFLYAVMFAAAPYIARFYENAELTVVIRVLSLSLIISGVRNVQQAFVSRHMLFKRFFYASMAGTIMAAVVGIWMAYGGYGVWALVAQQLVNAAIGTFILWIVIRWRPIRAYSWQRWKGLFAYGWKLLASSLLDTVYNDFRQLVIGKLYSPADLGFYNRGRQFPFFIVNNINASIDSVLLPTMSKAQDDRITVKAMTRRAIRTSTFIMAPLMMGLAAMAEPIVRIVLTETWLESVPYLQIFCVTFMFYPIHTANLNAIKALGRSDLFLKLEIIKKAAGLIILFSVMQYGVLVIACSMLLSSFISQIVNAWPNKKLLDYRYVEQLKDILPSISLAVFMGLVVWGISKLPLGLPTLLLLALQLIIGAAVYICCSIMFKLESFYYVVDTIKDFKDTRKARNS